MKFINKVAIITGGGSGIGAATARLFTKEGAKVVIVDRNNDKLKKVREDCTKIGKEPFVIHAELSKDDEVKKVINETVQEYNSIDVLVNNAGTGIPCNLLDKRILQVFDEIMSINLRSVVHLTHLAAPHLIKSKGNIVNIASINSFVTVLPYLIPYSISKAGVSHFTRGAALELAPFGVRVNAVCPGPVNTGLKENIEAADKSWNTEAKLTALKRFSEPDEIADLIAFLASDAAKGITGSNYVHDNGLLVK